MRVKSVAVVLSLLAVCSLPGVAAAEDDLIEHVVVRNRLYSMDNRLELGLGVGFSVLGRLTDHINLNAIVGYNVSDSFGFELRGGYAVSRHTGLARRIANTVLVTSQQVFDTDLSDLWEMKANGALGIRWAPIYGKISLLAEVPLHFQLYLWLGGGAGTFERESVIACTNGSIGAGGTCNQYLVDTKVSGFASGAIGFRFFTHRGGSLKLELRDYSFPDSYRVQIDRNVALTGAQTGTAAPSPGFTHLVLVDLGYVFIF